MSKTNSIENYVAELHRRLPPSLRNRRQLVQQVSTQLRERADSHLWAALAHGDDISFEEAERHALMGFGPPAKVARSLTKAHSRGRVKRRRWDSAGTAAILGGCAAVVLVGSFVVLVGVDDNEPVPVNEAVSDRAVAAAGLLGPPDLIEIEREGASGNSYEVEFLEANGDEIEVQLDRHFEMAMVAAPGNAPTAAHVTRARTAARSLSLQDDVRSVERGMSDGTYEIELNMAGSQLEVLLDSELNVMTATRD
jgi:hypothetical protein